MPISLEDINFDTFIRLKLGGTQTVTGRRIAGKKGDVCQLETIEDKQAKHTNVALTELKDLLEIKLETAKSLTVWTEGKTYQFSRSKKGRILSRSEANGLTRLCEQNDRVKTRVLQGIVPAFVRVEIMTPEGKIKADKQEKFRQIDRFTELVADVVKDEKSLRITDFGCGKSYLGFAVRHYLVEQLGVAVEITGIDLKREVIEDCQKIAADLGINDMRFIAGNIADQPLDKSDMMISLHACDTATDLALYHAIRAGVRYVFSVPCCQHEINQNMKGGGLIGAYGILRERYAAIVTDAVRAALLTSCGYRTQVLEYVDSDRSLKNVMIRAVKADVSAAERERARREAQSLLSACGAEQTLYTLLYG